MLRLRESRREESLDAHASDATGNLIDGIDAEQEAQLTDAVGFALLVVLEKLSPVERVAFVLHDMFGFPFDEIAAIVGRSPAAARQLASRARRRVQEAATASDPDPVRRREIVEAFLAASRGGDLTALLALLDPDAVVRADAAAVQAGATKEVRGAAAVADTFSSRARFAQPALVNEAVGAVWAPGGRPRVVFAFTITRGNGARVAARHGCQDRRTPAAKRQWGRPDPSRTVEPPARVPVRWVERSAVPATSSTAADSAFAVQGRTCHHVAVEASRFITNYALAWYSARD